jgi:hypothetical protein
VTFKVKDTENDYTKTKATGYQMNKWLWLTLIPSLAFAATRPCTLRQDAVYMDVHPNKVIICADDKEIGASELLSTDNDFEQLIRDIEKLRDVRYPLLVLRPGSEQIQHTLLKTIRKYDVDLGIEPWETTRPFSRKEIFRNWEEAIGVGAGNTSGEELEAMLQMPTLLPTPLEAYTEGKNPVFFECRNNQLFSISIDNSNQTNRHNEGYSFDSPSDETDEMWFGAQLAKLDPETQYIAFYIYPDSLSIFRKARQLTWYKDLESTCELRSESGPLVIDTDGDLLLPERALKHNEDFEQAGAGYPPQSVGSPDP